MRGFGSVSVSHSSHLAITGKPGVIFSLFGEKSKIKGNPPVISLLVPENRAKGEN